MYLYFEGKQLLKTKLPKSWNDEPCSKVLDVSSTCSPGERPRLTMHAVVCGLLRQEEPGCRAAAGDAAAHRTQEVPPASAAVHPGSVACAVVRSSHGPSRSPKGSRITPTCRSLKQKVSLTAPRPGDTDAIQRRRLYKTPGPQAVTCPLRSVSTTPHLLRQPKASTKLTPSGTDSWISGAVGWVVAVDRGCSL